MVVSMYLVNLSLSVEAHRLVDETKVMNYTLLTNLQALKLVTVLFYVISTIRCHYYVKYLNFLSFFGDI